MAAMLVVFQTQATLAHSGTADEQSACTPDVLSLCFWDIPNEDKIVACLNKKIDRLSPACRKVIDGPPEKKDARTKR
jgi:hypothetical protein